MENTACGEDCPFVKQGFCSSDNECPHFVKSCWQDSDTKELVIVKDCSPKRVLLQQNILFNQVFALQQSLTEARNEYQKLSSVLLDLVEKSKLVILEKSKTCQNTGKLDYNNQIGFCPLNGNSP